MAALFVSDVDGTLVDRKGRLSASTRVPGWHWLSVHDQRATKAVALTELCLALGVALGDVTVFGDERNDIPMFQVAGRGVAVANAHAELKQHAHQLIGDHETDSVLAYLEAAHADVAR